MEPKKLLLLMIITLTVVLVIVASARCITSATVKSDYANIDLSVDYSDNTDSLDAR